MFVNADVFRNGKYLVLSYKVRLLLWRLCKSEDFARIFFYTLTYTFCFKSYLFITTLD